MLPIELIDEIVYYTGNSRLCILVCSDQLVKKLFNSKYSWDYFVNSGDLEVLKYLYKKTSIKDVKDVQSTIKVAAENGHLELVKWLYSICPDSFVGSALISAAKYGHFEIVKFLGGKHSKNCSFKAYKRNRSLECSLIDERTKGQLRSITESCDLIALRDVQRFIDDFERKCQLRKSTENRDLRAMQVIDEFGRFESYYVLNQHYSNCKRIIKWLNENHIEQC